MKTLSLFGIFLLAKILVLPGHNLPCSLWTPLAYLWQDALVAMIFGALEWLTRRQPWFSWSIYGGAVLYVAISVPLMRILSSPLTLQMSRAAGGALADSIKHYLTWKNLGLIVAVLLAGVVLPIFLRKLPRQSKLTAAFLAIIFVALGPLAVTRVETSGLHRNALAALITSALPRVKPAPSQQDWRSTSSVEKHGVDLSRFHGAATGRNVIMILLESTGARYLRPYGAVEDPMANLSRLAETSLLFENAYSVYPESIKGLFSVLCSRYPAFDTGPGSYARVITPAIAHVLAKAGYRTALFHSGRFMYLGMDSVIQNRGYQIMEDAGAISGNFHSSFGVDEPATVKRMLAWIDSLPHGQPFFITYLPIAGHHPYDTPEPGPFAGQDDERRYLNALHYGDQALGEFLDGLKRRGLETNTLFVIFGDHGEAFGQHEGNYGHTLFIQEENVHVPYLVAAPGWLQQQVRVSRVASLIDTAPTILDLLGLPTPADYQGSSLLNSENRMALFCTDYSLGFLGLRDGPWKFIYELESKRSKLFDLSTDTEEQNDLAHRFPERVLAYRRHLERWSAAQKDLVIRAT